jgi:hypothetical protein
MLFQRLYRSAEFRYEAVTTPIRNDRLDAEFTAERGRVGGG